MRSRARSAILTTSSRPAPAAAAQAVICAVFSAWLARQKNYAPARWFILGLVFGIFGLIAIAGAPHIFSGKQLEAFKRKLAE